MCYAQLTQEERYQIYILKKAEYKQAEIAGELQGTFSFLHQVGTILVVWFDPALHVPVAVASTDGGTSVAVGRIRPVLGEKRRVRRRPEDKPAGYINGADSYLTKPAALEEFNVAIQAPACHLRHTGSSALRLDICRMAQTAGQPIRSRQSATGR